jgi:hypothetical protein
MPIEGLIDSARKVRPFSATAQKAVTACNNLLTNQSKNLNRGQIPLKVLKNCQSYKPAKSPLALFGGKTSGLDAKEIPKDGKYPLAVDQAVFIDIEKRASVGSDMSSFVQLLSETIHGLVSSVPLTDEQQGDLQTLSLGLMVASRDQAVLSTINEVNLRLIRREAFLASSALPRDVKEKLRRSSINTDSLFDPSLQSVVDEYHNSLPYVLSSGFKKPSDAAPRASRRPSHRSASSSSSALQGSISTDRSLAPVSRGRGYRGGNRRGQPRNAGRGTTSQAVSSSRRKFSS